MKTLFPTLLGLAIAIGLAALPTLSSAQNAGPRPLPPATPPTALGQKVLLTVDGTEIKEADVRERFMARFAQQFQGMPPEQQAAVQPQIEQMIMTELISKTLLLNAANKDGFKASKEDVDKSLEEIKKSLPEGATLEQFAASAGLSLDHIRSQMADDMKIRQLIEKVTSEIAKPDEAEVKKNFEENPDKFKQDESIHASHILVSTQGITDEAELAKKKATAESLHAQLVEKKGENFAELARAHSDCPSKAQGGDLGEFGRGQMVPEFEKAAFSQEVGAIGDTIQTKFGYHIIKVTEKKEAKEVVFADVQEKLAETLLEERKAEKMQGYLKELRGKAKIEQPGQPAASPAPEVKATPAVDAPKAAE